MVGRLQSAKLLADSMDEARRREGQANKSEDKLLGATESDVFIIILFNVVRALRRNYGERIERNGWCVESLQGSNDGDGGGDDDSNDNAELLTITQD